MAELDMMRDQILSLTARLDEAEQSGARSGSRHSDPAEDTEHHAEDTEHEELRSRTGSQHEGEEEGEDGRREGLRIVIKGTMNVEGSYIPHSRKNKRQTGPIETPIHTQSSKGVGHQNTLPTTAREGYWGFRWPT